MKIGILGTGVVGRGHSEKLITLGHEVMIGTRDPEASLAKTGVDEMGNLAFGDWHKDHPEVKVGTFAETAEFGEIVFDDLKGEVALTVLQGIPSEFLTGKVLIDVANPLDFSKGMPPTLLVANTDSLAEQIQNALPKTKVVKTFNTINAHLQTHPEELVSADHTIFLAGDDAEAKKEVLRILESYGWKDILDLGGIKSARGMEMFLPLWLEIWGALGMAKFNIKVIRE